METYGICWDVTCNHKGDTAADYSDSACNTVSTYDTDQKALIAQVMDLSDGEEEQEEEQLACGVCSDVVSLILSNQETGLMTLRWLNSCDCVPCSGVCVQNEKSEGLEIAPEEPSPEHPEEPTPRVFFT